MLNDVRLLGLIVSALVWWTFACGQSEDPATTQPAAGDSPPSQGSPDGTGTTPSPTPAPTATPSPTPTPTPTPVPQPEELLERTGQTMRELQSFSFYLEHIVGNLQFMPGVNVRNLDGYVSADNRLAMTFGGDFGGFVVKVDVVGIDDKTYVKNPLNDEWEISPLGFTPLAFFSPYGGIVDIMAQAIDPVFTDATAEDGDYNIRHKMPASALDTLIGDTAGPSSLVDVDLTIDAETERLVRAHFVGILTPVDTEDAERFIELFDFNMEKTVEEPTVEE